eukprot:TRINITY_DN2409_c0_g1_i3.p1 TRINITY_DN2409_c0_g1~~TRINITY_DN2409_c0_g1_i3.p1  ORF type:complete len:342 (+),score=49.86 TRINITY_DN2409_c0_g1_i3:25-1050(+)
MVEIRFCNTTRKLEDAMERMMRAKRVAVDLEGRDLGRDGEISLVQLYCEGDDVVYILDATADMSGLEDYIYDLFSDDSILKVMFDCRSDCDALRHLWGVDHFNHIMDLQLLEVLTRKGSLQRSNTRIKSLKKCLKEFSISDTKNQDVVSKKMENEGSAFWMKRPLQKQLLEYAAEDVSALFKLRGAIWLKRTDYWPDQRIILDASSRYAYLKADIEDSKVLQSPFHNNSLLPLLVITNANQRRYRNCKGCQRKVREQKKGSKSPFCVVCQRVEREAGETGGPSTLILLQKTTMCRKGDECRRKMLGDCRFAHEREELRCRTFALEGVCNNPRCNLKHTHLE